MTGADSTATRRNADFTLGVVEGFYGMPWSTEQEKYYLVDILSNLIASANERGVTFVYAISPGLDISFSNTKDVHALKRKLEQVATFGCRAFALLFDDIDPELSEADRSAFSSFARAQCPWPMRSMNISTSPSFSFAYRSVPNVQSSAYLNTIGAKLLPGIDVMWTGCKVISKKITIKTLEDISAVLRRAPVIWDNIHANDYDPRRVFLGPYDGRSPEIIPYIRGVLTNPNCEFEANYIACHTLGQWCKSNKDGVKKDIIANERLSPVAADIRLETEDDFGAEEDPHSHGDLLYSPRQALKTAMGEWLEEFSVSRHPPRRHVPPPVSFPPPGVPPSIPPGVPPMLPPGPPTGGPSPPGVPPLSSNQGPLIPPESASASQDESLLPPDMPLGVPPIPFGLPPVPEGEPPVPVAPPTLPLRAHPDANKADSSESPMQMEVCGTNDKPESSDGMAEASASDTSASPSELTVEDIGLLVDLFYLPFEHGSRACQLLNSLHWLVNNVHSVTPAKKESEENGSLLQYKEWQNRAADFEQTVAATDILLRRLFYSPNKSVLCCVHAYVWDLKCTLSVCLAYVRWLGFSEGYKEAFMSGDMEPWAFRGGLQTELQRMLPIAAAHDLFFIKPPDIIVPQTASFRPYQPQDEEHVYDICLKTCDDGMDGTDVFPENPRLIGDRLVGRFLALSPEFSFVVEDDTGVYGYIWQPVMPKYPKPLKDDISPAEEVMLSFHNDPVEVSEEIYRCYPSVLRLDILPNRMCDPAVPRRLLACALCALKAAGSYGVHTELNAGDEFMADFYAKLGFFTVGGDAEKGSEDMVYMGRLF
ncbi:hypothetical protein BaRGS_00023824 [Batillaria attramentaria]|uniref:GH84 domain-containing protein n=1 Tax=Batillaria attramentaria TaxID=370345 RepID=A0ABD0KCS8_9CAEN